MEDWEDEPVATIIKKEQPKNNWDEEDIEESDVKDSWEDEDVPTSAHEPEPPAKSTVKLVGKASGKKEKNAEVENEVLSDPVLEKLRQQRLVEEADYKSTTELFAKRSDEKSLDNFIPKSENDFLEYAELVSHKLQPYEAVMRLSVMSMKAADAKEVASSITAIANEKLKAEKEANAGKKKTGAKKKQLHVDKADDDVVVVDGYDAVGDYDFM